MKLNHRNDIRLMAIVEQKANFLRLTLKRLHVHRRYMDLFVALAFITFTKLIPDIGMAYTRTFYKSWASMIAPISGCIPFPIGDVFITASICWVVAYPVYSLWYKRRSKGMTFLRVAEYLAWVYVWFYLSWGLNYSQPDIYHRMNMQPVEVSASAFRQFAYQYVDSLNAAFVREERKMKGNEHIRKDMQSDILKGYAALGHNAERMGINRPFCRYAPAKTMLFSRLSSMAGVTGSMAPFFTEFTLNAYLQPHEYPATFAHEYAHFLGIANEGEANFYSYIVCTSSSDRAIRFSGYYHILFHTLANVRQLLGEHEYAAYMHRIRPEIITLARHDRQYWLSRRSNTIDAAQNFVYNLYLKGNRVEDGMKSYSGVIGIIMAWKAIR